MIGWIVGGILAAAGIGYATFVDSRKLRIGDIAFVPHQQLRAQQLTERELFNLTAGALTGDLPVLVTKRIENPKFGMGPGMVDTGEGILRINGISSGIMVTFAIPSVRFYERDGRQFKGGT